MQFRDTCRDDVHQSFKRDGCRCSARRASSSRRPQPGDQQTPAAAGTPGPGRADVRYFLLFAAPWWEYVGVRLLYILYCHFVDFLTQMAEDPVLGVLTGISYVSGIDYYKAQ